MQPWQSVLLILITLIVFGAGFYYDQIEKNTAVAYEDSLVKTQKQIVKKPESNTSSEVQSSTLLKKSSAWAETNIVIKVNQNNSHLSYLHKEAMKGKTFLTAVIKTLDKNPTAKEIIFSPFINDIFTESESSIMQSLYSVAQDNELPTQLLLIVRGHSGKASSLLTKAITDTYQNELKNETADNPLLPDLLNLIKKVRILEENQLQLAEQIEEENENSSGQTIEEIALRSEIIQITTEINSHVVALKEIEKIHLAQKEPVEYLSIQSIANFGNVQEFLNNIEQLKRMLVSQALEPILKIEVTKNLDKLESSLNQELAKGIENIKELSRTALKRKIELQKRRVDFEMKKNDIHSLHPRFKLLKSVTKQLNEMKAVFASEFDKWQQAKGGLTFKKRP
jgi:hypothetical protein